MTTGNNWVAIIPVGRLVSDAVQMRTGGRAALTLLSLMVAAVTVTGCLGRSSRTLPQREVLGGATSTPLVIQAVSGPTTTRITEATALHDIQHPFSEPQLSGGLRQFGLARVTVSSLAGDGTGSLPVYHQHLAWVGVYEISKGADTSCPAEPSRLPKHLPPVFAHYYFAVLVDADTGQATAWNEDMSGLLLRECDGTAS